MSGEGWWSGDLYLRRDVRDLELVMLADDLHVAEAVTWWNDKNDLAGKNFSFQGAAKTPQLGKERLPKERLVKFDEDRAYELCAGGFTRGGSEILCFHLPEPPTLHTAAAKGTVPFLLTQKSGQSPNDAVPVDWRRCSNRSSAMMQALSLSPTLFRRERGSCRGSMRPRATVGTCRCWWPMA